MPYKPFAEASLAIGDRLRFRADGEGRVVIERIGEGTGLDELSRPRLPPAD